MAKVIEMQTFVAVVETGSMSAAAEQLGVGVSAVSRRLGELEQTVGARLANRSPRGLTATPAGLAYYDRVVRILSDISEADMEAGGRDSAQAGTIRLAAPLSFGTRVLAPIMNAYALDHPDIRLDIDLSDRRVDIAEEGFDLAIRIGTLEDSSLIRRSLGRIRHICAARPDYWDKYGRPDHPDDLRDLPVIHYPLSGQPSVWRYLDHAGDSGAVRVVPRISVGNGEYAVAAALDGLGCVLEPDFICGEAVQAGQLEAVLEETVWYDMSVNALWTAGRPQPARVRRFIEYLAGSL